MSGREESPLDANQFMAVMNPNQKRKLGLQIGMKHTIALLSGTLLLFFFNDNSS
jgi:hypothetical protein